MRIKTTTAALLLAVPVIAGAAGTAATASYEAGLPTPILGSQAGFSSQARDLALMESLATNQVLFQITENRIDDLTAQIETAEGEASNAQAEAAATYDPLTADYQNAVAEADATAREQVAALVQRIHDLQTTAETTSAKNQDAAKNAAAQAVIDRDAWVQNLRVISLFVATISAAILLAVTLKAVAKTRRQKREQDAVSVEAQELERQDQE